MRGTEHLHPELRAIAAQFLERCKADGLNVLITDTWRTKAEQDDCVRRKTSKAVYPTSPHNWGVAFDFCRNVKGREYDDSDNFFAKCGAVGKKLGLFWGGDFKTTKDKPHLEYIKYMPNCSTKTLQLHYVTPEVFKSTWPPFNTQNSALNISPPPAASMPVLKKGAKSEVVKTLQTALNQYGYKPLLSIDGSFGPATDKAVRAFQKVKGLVVDGSCGPKTWAALGYK